MYLNMIRRSEEGSISKGGRGVGGSFILYRSILSTLGHITESELAFQELPNLNFTPNNTIASP
jgi:hypothetical protein